MQNYYSYPTSPITYNQDIPNQTSPSTNSYFDSVNDSSYTYSYWPSINYSSNYHYSSPSTNNYYYNPSYEYENFSTQSNPHITPLVESSYQDISYGYTSSYYNASISEPSQINSTTYSNDTNENYFKTATTDFNTKTNELPKNTEKQQTKKTRSLAKRNQLPDEAVDILNDWFDNHLDNPYPQIEEKERLAKIGNITVKQVTAWFSNRRNRSQNTKPMRIKRQLESQINGLFHLITDDSNKEQIIKKFRETITY